MALSIQAFKWAKTVDNVTATEKYLLIWIADHYNEKDGYAFPSRKRLADNSKLSTRTITRNAKSLATKGLIRVQECIESTTGQNKSNRYFLPNFDPASNKRNPKDRVYVATKIVKGKKQLVEVDAKEFEDARAAIAKEFEDGQTRGG